MASLASVAMPADDVDLDDASMPESEDMTAAAEDVMSAIKSGDTESLKTALEAFVLSVK